MAKVMTEDVQTILRRIALRSKDDGWRFTDESRVNAIKECLATSAWTLYSDGRLAKIWNHEGFDPSLPVIVVSSHVDMVAESCYSECEGELWNGSFDNLITNAIVVALMLKEEFGPQVLVAFTGDEEEESRGADEVVQTLSARGCEVRFVIATDVTEEGWRNGKAFSLENILPEDEDVQDRIAGLLRPALLLLDEAPQIIVDGDPDEAWEYDEWDLPCCSLCIPCCGDMHSEEGVEVRSADVPRYAAALAACTFAGLML